MDNIGTINHNTILDQCKLFFLRIWRYQIDNIPTRRNARFHNNSIYRRTISCYY